MLPETRAQLGIFLSFQHPLEIAGVRMDQFMRSAYNSVQKQNNNERLQMYRYMHPYLFLPNVKNVRFNSLYKLSIKCTENGEEIHRNKRTEKEISGLGPSSHS